MSQVPLLTLTADLTPGTAGLILAPLSQTIALSYLHYTKKKNEET